jgi:hypothetical protein
LKMVISWVRLDQISRPIVDRSRLQNGVEDAEIHGGTG